MAKPSTPIADLLLHPVRWRIVQRVLGREVTTSQLRSELPDVSTTTLYRQVATLLDAGVLQVIKEERARGAIERTLALRDADRHRAAGAAEGAAMSPAQHRVGLNLVLAQIAGDYDRAVDQGLVAARGDELSYGQAALYLGPDDLPRLQAELDRVLAPYLQPPDTEDRRRLLLSVIAIPDT
jgi:hypothetical protein